MDGTVPATRAPARRRNGNAEAIIQAAIVDWLRVVGFPMTFHVPNGGLRGKREAAKLKWQGVLPGAPDLCVPIPGGRVLWIEVKSDVGVLSSDQKAFRDWCAANGHIWTVVRSIDDVRSFFIILDVTTRESSNG